MNDSFPTYNPNLHSSVSFVKEDERFVPLEYPKHFKTLTDESTRLMVGISPNLRRINRAGLNLDVDGAADVWAGGGLYQGFPTGQIGNIVISSSDSQDTYSSGQGAREVIIKGLDNDYIERSENIQLSGLNPVTGQISFKRVFTVEVSQAGSVFTNSGVLTTYHDGNIFSKIPEGYGISQLCTYTIPSGMTGYLESFSAQFLAGNNTNQNNWAGLAIVSKNERGVTLIRQSFLISSQNASSADTRGGDLVFLPKTDITMRILSTSQTDAKIAGRMAIILCSGELN